jgi:lactate dehydrogenase-like 2-hydroxyacid dehydrogenase
VPSDRQKAGRQAAVAPLVLVPDAEFDGPPDLEEAIFGASARLAIHRAHKADEIPAELWRDCAGILAWHNVTIGDDQVEKLENCRIIVRVGAGFDNMALAACGRHGIAVCNVPDYGVNEVADHAIALMLSLGRGIVRYHGALVDDPVAGWDVEKTPAIRRFNGLTFGVVGMGRIGTAAARRAAAFGLRILFYDPYLPTGAELGLGFARADSLAALLEQSDIVSLHTPLTAETRFMIDDAALALMRPDAVLINTARGPIVDLDALAAALRAGRLSAAGLDVLPQEPPLAETALLRAVQRREPWTIGRVIITPHAAWYSRDSFIDLRRKAALVARDFLRDGRLRDCVNRQFLPAGTG